MIYEQLNNTANKNLSEKIKKELPDVVFSTDIIVRLSRRNRRRI